MYGGTWRNKYGYFQKIEDYMSILKSGGFN